jgi:hypothetical protein
MQLIGNKHTEVGKLISIIILIFNIISVTFLYLQKLDAQNICAVNSGAFIKISRLNLYGRQK